jgi:acetyl esterase/lipase
MSNVATPEALPAINQLAGECIERFFDVLIRRGPSRAIDRSFLRVNSVSDVEPWSGLLTANSPGTLPPTIPIFLAQGTKDPLVLPRVTLDYMAKLCKAGSVVRFDSMPGVGHAFAGRDSAVTAIDWITDRFNGITPPNNCAPN